MYEFGFRGLSLFGLMFTIIPILGLLIAVCVFVLFGVIIAKNIKQKNCNRSLPLLTVRAKVVAKRSDVRGHSSHHTGSDYLSGGASRTNYYATFEVESGDRMELRIPPNEIGYLVEGDIGSLSFRGTEYINFVRG